MKINPVLKIFLILLFLLLNLYFLPSKGTGDVDNWINIILALNGSETGNFFSECLKYNCPVFYPLTYPPGHLILMSALTKFMPQNIIGALLLFKLSVFFFYLLGLFSLLLIYFSVMGNNNYKFGYLDVTLVYFSSLSLILNTQILGYTDIYFLPLLLLSIFFIFRTEFIISGLLFSVSVLIKWQALILMPLILIYLYKSNRDFKKILYYFFGFALPVLLLSRFDPTVINSLKLSLFGGAAANIFLSAGLNLSWILTELLGQFSSFPITEFSSGYNYIIIKEFYPNGLLLLIPKIIFILTYFFLITRFAVDYSASHRDKIYLFFKYAVLVFLSYFVISSGVHENHLATALFLGIPFFLLYPSKLHLGFIIYLELYNFSSMFIFYGLDGNTLMPNGFLNLNHAFIASIFFCLLFFYFMARLITEEPNGKSMRSKI